MSASTHGVRFHPVCSILCVPFATSRQTRFAQTCLLNDFPSVSITPLPQMAHPELPQQAAIPSIL
jgi:hypothetical protein